MKITSISTQIRDPNRVNVSIDGKYRLSLDMAQVVELGVKQGQEIDDERLAELQRESEFGKLYARTLEYCLLRPRSQREVRDYLYRKTLAKKYRTKKGDIKQRDGVSSTVTQRVFERLQQKGHIDDEAFARYWVENRNQRKGSSLRKLRAELAQKGVAGEIVEQVLAISSRNDSDELAKMIAKKRTKYPDQQKLVAYLARQGFRYDDIIAALTASDES